MAPSGRHTNLALLVLLAWALATGFLAFAVGQGWGRWIGVAHGVLGLGLLLLVPWKTAIVRRGVRRRGTGSAPAVAFGVLVVVAIIAGVGHATGLWIGEATPTAMQVHVGAALVAVPFGVWHVATRWVRPRRADLSRRTLVRAGVLAAASAGIYGVLAGLAVVTRLPGRDRRFTGSYERGSHRPELMPVTQWLNDPILDVDPARWSLEVRADGASLRAFRLEELDAVREPVTAVLDCTGGWWSEQRWEGVRLDRLLASAGRVEGRSVRILSLSGYDRRFPLADASRIWVATRVAGEALSSGHGFPARIVAPGRRGFWWVKWLSTIEVDARPWWWQPPFPLE